MPAPARSLYRRAAMAALAALCVAWALAPRHPFTIGLNALVFVQVFLVFRSEELAHRHAQELTANLLAKNAHLDDLSKRLRLATRAAKIGVWDWNIDTNDLEWDDRMFALYGVQRTSSGTTYDIWRAGMHPDDAARCDAEMKAALDGVRSFDTTFRVRWPTGEIRHVRGIANIERGGSGSPTRVIGVNWDVTKETEVDRQKSEFVSLAAHQLKTPVGSLGWTLELFLDGDLGKLTKAQRDALEDMADMTQRMRRMVNKLLDLSRIEMQMLSIETVPTDPSAICDETLAEFEERRAKKNIHLQRRYGHGRSFPADPNLLHMVFRHYLSNAMKYAPEGGHVEVLVEDDGTELQIAVTNDGPVISEDDKPRIFEKFYRTAEAIAVDPNGDGLGLYTAKKVVETCGGRVWFESWPTRTTFHAAFPSTGMVRTTAPKDFA